MRIYRVVIITGFMMLFGLYPGGPACAAPVEGLELTPDGRASFDFMYTYFTQNITVDADKVYVRSSRLLVKGGYGITTDFSFYGLLGMSSFTDENIDSDMGFSYGVGAQFKLVRFESSAIPDAFKNTLVFIGDARFFGYSTSGKSKETNLGMDAKWQEGQFTMGALAKAEKMDLFAGVSLDLTRGNMSTEEGTEITYNEDVMFGFRFGGAYHLNKNVKLWAGAGALDEFHIALGGSYTTSEKNVALY